MRAGLCSRSAAVGAGYLVMSPEARMLAVVAFGRAVVSDTAAVDRPWWSGPFRRVREPDTRLVERQHQLAALLRRALAHHDTSLTVVRLDDVREQLRQREELGAAFPVVVVGCSSRKLDRPAAARDLYIGSYHRAARAAALSVTVVSQVLVLSGRYGLVDLSTQLSPYTQRIDDPGAVDDVTLSRQVREFSLHRRRVVVLAGRVYADRLAAHVAVERPLAGTGGIGQQLAVLSEIAASGQLPGTCGASRF